MNLLTDYYFSIITDNSETAESISSFISENFTQLVKAFRHEGVDLADLVCHMVPEDFMGRYREIRSLIPELDPEIYLRSISYPENYWEEMLEEGIEPDLIVRAWPNLLTFEQKLEADVSPDLILETESSLDNGRAVRLLESGASPDKVAQKAELFFEQRVEYGINPKSTIYAAMRTNDNIVRDNITRLFRNGLTTEELLEAEIAALSINICDCYKIFDWYIAQFEQIVKFAEDREGLTRKLMRLVDEMYFTDDWMPLETVDCLFIKMMRKCVEYGLISQNDAVEYLCGIHPESIEDDEDGDPIPFESRLLDQDYVRIELAV